ncbi:MAG: zf-HC2 domain-containing protein [Planctomycetes bacterium]|nr:zf-HC2 domain-containing protein [Planctomycetota bacterium]
MSERNASCEDFWTLISARLDGELAPGDRQALEAHLAACAACRSVDEAFRLQDSGLRRAFVPRRKAAAAVGEGVAAAVEAPRRRAAWRAWLAPAAAAAAGFLVAWALFRSPEQAARQAAPPKVAQVERAPRELRAQPAAPADAARLTFVTGKVEMLLPGSADWVPVPTGGSIEPGTRVRTGPEVLCELRGADGSDLWLNERTEVAFRQARSFDLARGQMGTRVERREAPFLVSAAGATIAAVGTRFDVETGPSGAVLTVIEGLTQVTGTGGAFLVRAGERATIVEGAVREKELVWNLLQATRWLNVLLARRPDAHPELARRVDGILALLGEAKMQELAEEEILELGESCVSPLLSYVQSSLSRPNRKLREKAAEIAGRLAVRQHVHELILLLADESAAVREHAAGALRRLTGEDQGRAPRDWRQEPWDANRPAFDRWLAWWKEHAKEYSSGP